jgi:hypothetical protein
MGQRGGCAGGGFSAGGVSSCGGGAAVVSAGPALSTGSGGRGSLPDTVTETPRPRASESPAAGRCRTIPPSTAVEAES